MKITTSQERDFVLAEFNEYLDSEGLMNDRPGKCAPSGNALLFTAEAFLIQLFLGVTRAYPVVAAAERLASGRFVRPGWEQDQEGPDDYIGLAAFSRHSDPTIAQRILAYGRSHFFKWGPLKFRYQYDTTGKEPNSVEAWFGRFPAVIAALEWAAGETPPMWRRLWLALSAALTPGAEGQDTWILSWLCLECLRRTQMCWFERWAIKTYMRRLYKYHPGGLKEVFTQYFGSDKHPITKYVNQISMLF